jgi:dihydroorotase
MTQYTWIKNGLVIDPANDREAIGDVFIKDGLIVDSLNDAEKQEATHFDAKGLVVAPGLVDIHVHFREPGQTHKEDIASGSRAAAAGGYTSVVCMPNTSPVCDNAGTLERINNSIEKEAVINVYTTGCLTMGMKGEELAPTGQLKQAGIVAVTDDGLCIQNNEIMRRSVEYATLHNLPIMDHCQDGSLTENAVMHEGEVSLKLGLKGWPRAAEDIVVARNIILSELTGARIHMQHVSSYHSVELLRNAKAKGINVTGEASPHHIEFTDACIGDYNTLFKMNPPLRTDKDRLALIEGLKDGTLDCIATDHAPHSPTEKDCEFDKAPFGIIGLENALASTLETLYHSKELSLKEVIALMTHKGAEICDLTAGTLSVGVAGDVCIFDPGQKWTVDAEAFKSKSRNCPWNGRTLRGQVKATFVEGKEIFRLR